MGMEWGDNQAVLPKVKKKLMEPTGSSPNAPTSTTAVPLAGDGATLLPFEEKCTSETCFQKMLLRVLFLTRGK